MGFSKRKRDGGAQGNISMWQLDVMSNAFVIAVLLVLLIAIVALIAPHGRPKILTDRLPVLYSVLESQDQKVAIRLAGQGGTNPEWAFDPNQSDNTFKQLRESGAVRLSKDGELIVDFADPTLVFDRELRLNFAVDFGDARQDALGPARDTAFTEKDVKPLSLALRRTSGGTGTVPPLKILTPRKLPDAIAHEAYDLALSATGGSPDLNGKYQWRLEGGLSSQVDTNALRQGRLKGVFTPGSHQIQLTAVDRRGVSCSDQYQLTVRDVSDIRPLTINAPQTLPDCVRLDIQDTAGAGPYQFPLAVCGGVAPYKWQKIKGPDWVSVDEQRGIVDLKPDASVAAGSHEMAFQVIDSAKPTAKKAATSALRLRVLAASQVEKPKVLTEKLPPAIRGCAYEAVLAASGFDERSRTSRWELVSYPSDLDVRLSAAGHLTATPAKAGAYDIRVRAFNCAGSSENCTLRLNVDDVARVEPLQILTAEQLPPAVAGVPYDLVLAARGGRGTYEWSLGGPAGSSGLAVLKDGHIKGTPIAAAAKAASLIFEVRVKDADGRNDNKKLVLVVTDVGFQPKPLRILTYALPKAVAGESTRIALSAVGGVPDYVWTGRLTCSDTIRPYVTLSRDGVLEVKVPEWEPGHSVEKAVLDVTVCDTQPTPEKQSARLELLVVGTECKVQKPWIPKGPIPAAMVGQPYRYYIPVRGGVPPYTAVLNGVLPAGLTFDRQEGCIQGKAQAQGAADFRAVITDARGDAAAAELRLEVIPAVRNASQEWWKYFGFAIMVIAYVILKQGVWDACWYQPRHGKLLRRGMRIEVTDKGAFMGFKTELSDSERQRVQRDYRSLRHTYSAITWVLRLGTLAVAGAYACYLFGPSW